MFLINEQIKLHNSLVTGVSVIQFSIHAYVIYGIIPNYSKFTAGIFLIWATLYVMQLIPVKARMDEAKANNIAVTVKYD